MNEFTSPVICEFCGKSLLDDEPSYESPNGFVVERVHTCRLTKEQYDKLSEEAKKRFNQFKKK